MHLNRAQGADFNQKNKNKFIAIICRSIFALHINMAGIDKNLPFIGSTMVL